MSNSWSSGPWSLGNGETGASWWSSDTPVRFEYSKDEALLMLKDAWPHLFGDASAGLSGSQEAKEALALVSSTAKGVSGDPSELIWKMAKGWLTILHGMFTNVTLSAEQTFQLAVLDQLLEPIIMTNSVRDTTLSVCGAYASRALPIGGHNQSLYDQTRLDMRKSLGLSAGLKMPKCDPNFESMAWFTHHGRLSLTAACMKKNYPEMVARQGKVWTDVCSPAGVDESGYDKNHYVKSVEDYLAPREAWKNRARSGLCAWAAPTGYRFPFCDAAEAGEKIKLPWFGPPTAAWAQARARRLVVSPPAAYLKRY